VDIGECAAIAMTAGFLKHRVSGFELIGGGYGSEDIAPDVFNYKFENSKTPGNRMDILRAACGVTSEYLKHVLPMYCTSRNWVDEFCKCEFLKLVTFCHSQTWWWGLSSNYDLEMIEEKIIPDVNHRIINMLQIINLIINRDNPLDFLNKKQINFSDIISKMYTLRKEPINSDLKDKLTEIINKSQAKDLVLSLWNSDSEENYIDANDAVSNLQKEARDDFIARSYSQAKLAKDEKSFFPRLPDEQKLILNEKAFKSLFWILDDYIPCAVLADAFVYDSHYSFDYSYGTSREDTYRVTSTGQSDVMERIMYGVDRKTDKIIKSEVKQFQMHAAQRFGELVEAEMKGSEPPPTKSFDFYDNKSRDTAAAYSIEDTSDDNLEEKHQSKLFDFDDDKQHLPHSGSFVGKWRGTITRTEEDSLGRVKFDCEVEIFKDENGNIKGNATTDSELNFEISDWEKTEEGIEFKINFEGDPNLLGECLVDANLTEWGLDCSFSDNGIRQHLILTKDREGNSPTKKHVGKRDSATSSELPTKNFLGALYSELEPFRLPFSSMKWDLDFVHMPVETAVELSQYLMDSTMKKQHFNSEVPTVGGEILTATITKDGGFSFI